ncbi:KpsF/GutQ family sugar-phosphate isomerase [Chromobacterium subtsugae]|uniref:KpsF/GutQ family sugar-phosphate isomerase n=1 Tax=Chromobacterium subtsugae TaxID=251747 RepID=A0ABS7FAP9_9NEIS|nr:MULTISPECIES: KpsF/GutQ family sugar-phosphate isomerase [Chromobacterium]KUM05676.1 D-arabinose 5-phosphate isomerase [Chromobacterium subtsugae]KZE87157.1 D-arabinose 5-phosphate isomerase [Chromobacterium sp. F49]MBW7565898.1 KpsF/GutQ family sugar-phosphate isomerase [Chromobacterium subtsugae]MBW8287062.1 KpsF/GutQ family sugar-phosphate isomerase [Chromobacterium subtsugae]OBU88171.1 D-arabinose 5-phosphate isomerase [Chromobacterium subtsugae]
MEKTHSTSRLEMAREVLQTEAAALVTLAERLNGDFLAAVDAILACPGRVIVTGMGKSGHVGRKIAATLASTGTPAFFVHPAEAAHGDLGMITGDDIVIALSNSGESGEVVSLLPALKLKGSRLIAITGRSESSLSQAADILLHTHVEREACPLNLAPTTSTTVQIALGDALAVTLMEVRGFSQSDFALSHPGGSLGRRLLVHVADLMHSGDALPRVAPGTLLKDALLEMSQKRLGMVTVCDADDTLRGIYTDGDLRRTLERSADVYSLKIDEVMGRSPRTIQAGKLAAEAGFVMKQNQITSLVVVDAAGKLSGVLHMHDLLQAGVF